MLGAFGLACQGGNLDGHLQDIHQDARQVGGVQESITQNVDLLWSMSSERTKSMMEACSIVTTK